MVQVLNLALTHTKRIRVWQMNPLNSILIGSYILWASFLLAPASSEHHSYWLLHPLKPFLSAPASSEPIWLLHPLNSILIDSCTPIFLLTLSLFEVLMKPAFSELYYYWLPAPSLLVAAICELNSYWLFQLLWSFPIGSCLLWAPFLFASSSLLNPNITHAAG
jgi:hypothetical protein